MTTQMSSNTKELKNRIAEAQRRLEVLERRLKDCGPKEREVYSDAYYRILAKMEKLCSQLQDQLGDGKTCALGCSACLSPLVDEALSLGAKPVVSIKTLSRRYGLILPPVASCVKASNGLCLIREKPSSDFSCSYDPEKCPFKVRGVTSKSDSPL